MMILKLLWNIQMICKMSTKIIEDYNPNKKRKVLIVFDDMITDMINNKNSIVTELEVEN